MPSPDQFSARERAWKGLDPWENSGQQPEQLWIAEPAINPNDNTSLPLGEGNALPFPTVPPMPPSNSTTTPNATQWFQYGIIDDYADEWLRTPGTPGTPPTIPNFVVTPNCWSRLVSTEAIQGALLYRQQ